MAKKRTKFKSFQDEVAYAEKFWAQRGWRLPPMPTNPAWMKTSAGMNDSQALERLRLATEVARFRAQQQKPKTRRGVRIRMEWDEFTTARTYRYEMPCEPRPHALLFDQPLVRSTYDPSDPYDEPDDAVVWCVRCQKEYALDQVTDVSDPLNPRPVEAEPDQARAFAAALALDDTILKNRISRALFDLGHKQTTNPTGWTQQKAKSFVKAMVTASEKYVEEESARPHSVRPQRVVADRDRGPETPENCHLGKPRLSLVKEVMAAIYSPFGDSQRHEPEPYEVPGADGKLVLNPKHCAADADCPRPVRSRGVCDMHRKRNERIRVAAERKALRVSEHTQPEAA